MNLAAQIDIPTPVNQEASRLFSPLFIQKALGYLRRSQIVLSFTKGNPESYFICSGIVKGDRKHEAKVVYKKRLENTPGGPVSTNCDCNEWTPEEHCSHSCALFITYLYNFIQSETGQQIATPTSGHPLAVTIEEFGTIINGPQYFKGTLGISTYSGLNYLLTTKKVTPFPVPSELNGKLLILLQTVHSSYYIKFAWLSPDEKRVDNISLFEQLYLFDWDNGHSYHIPTGIKALIQKVRREESVMNVEEVLKEIKRLEPEEKEKVELLIDNTPQLDFPVKEVFGQVHLRNSEKKRLIEMSLVFHDENEKVVAPPNLLRTLSFEGGLLSSFKRKKDAYDFIYSFVEHLDNNDGGYKKELYQSHYRGQIQDTIDELLETEQVKIFDPHEKVFYSYKTDFVKLFITRLFKDFGELLFRFSSYDDASKEVSYKISPSNLFQGLTSFQRAVTPFGVSLLYERKEITKWKSKIRFERRSSGTKWFDLELNISNEDLELLRNIDLDTGLALTKQGLIAVDQDQKNLIKFLKKYTEHESVGKTKDEKKEGEENQNNKFYLPFNKARIFELFELRKLGVDGALTESELALCQRLATLEEMPEYPLPEKVKDILRPYQKVGYQWLRFLYENNLGACLADDMGLGKTLQTITFIQSIIDKVDRVLIVCPVTILLNWKKEFQKFSDLDVQIYHGGARTLNESKIVLTSYGVMKKETEGTFNNMKVDLLVLDEVQHLKNIRSQGAYAARKIEAGFRICLTGTPVENDLAEFYNILDLSIPGVWGDLQFIRTVSNKKSRLLARKTASPFILRRTKDQVLKDLPPKEENNVYLSFKEEEKNTYFKELVSIKNNILQAPSKKKYGEILRGLLILRQKCLWQGSRPNQLKDVLSTKIDFLVETLEQIIEEGHQAIVFSQFTTYLDIIQNVVQEKHWKMARIDGSQSVKKRQEQVDLFQEGKTPVFLISLKAGGVGLNLTAASYVFVMDPWWNPAVEQQAIDRAHRIGQQNTLTVYRPIIEGSIEEKVLQLQKRKKQLFQDLLEDKEDNLFTGKLTMKDFELLLS